MSARTCAATERAIDRVKSGESAYKAAKEEGIARSTIYRALKRIRREKHEHAKTSNK